MTQTMPVSGQDSPLNENEPIDLANVPSGTRIRIDTEVAEYEIMVIDPGENLVRVQGGESFPFPEVACLEGSVASGSLFWPNRIQRHTNMRFLSHGKRILSALVQSFSLLPRNHMEHN